MAPDEGTTADNSPAQTEDGCTLRPRSGAPCPSADAARRGHRDPGLRERLPPVPRGRLEERHSSSRAAARPVGSWNALSVIAAGRRRRLPLGVRRPPRRCRAPVASCSDSSYKAEFVADGESEVGVDDERRLRDTGSHDGVAAGVHRRRRDTLAGYDGDFFSEFDNWVSELSTTGVDGPGRRRAGGFLHGSSGLGCARRLDG